MNDYLEKILKGQAINYEAFLKKLPEPFRRQSRALFATKRVSPNRWRVTVLDQQAFEALQQQMVVPLSRAEAASQGDSHRHTTGVSFLLVYHKALSDSRPDVVVNTGQSVAAAFQPAPRVLVVENETNFYHYQRMLAYASDCLGKPLTLSDCDVVFGSGNRITRRADVEWLAGYDEVLCAFDYDAGGLQMFRTVQATLGRKAQYLQPSDWRPWLACFRKSPETTERFTRAVLLAEDLGFGPLAQAFRSTGKFMEQEMILND
ncbi:DUF2220 domain-containing protein [Marinobacter daepoensis]|uniref:Wadjet protein JetD C-terminal domain-containing protein n=1 Tax=Marinobacter daepoensis TaxID=262077 RepID=A0ABS3BIM1_9GAMM|nr:hypothetical protein [Marinobacter daepoensis]MBY6080789.1 DUF2220 domain-containing protein [Marinobacter daepoensis]